MTQEEREMINRNSIFIIKDNIWDKCCMTIIDAGSTENLVFMVMIDKLVFNFQLHSNSYRVSLLQKGHHIILTCQLLESFSRFLCYMIV